MTDTDATSTTPSATPPAVGAPAPDFTLPASDGSQLHLADLQGQPILLYFYPKDDTPGCTSEACGFRDNWQALQARGIVVLGVSRDSVKSHQKFAAKHGLPFTLLADEDGRVAQLYGVWVEKSMYGKRYMTMTRASFYIRPNGTIGHIWPQVKPEGHATEVLDVITADRAIQAD